MSAVRHGEPRAKSTADPQAMPGPERRRCRGRLPSASARAGGGPQETEIDGKRRSNQYGGWIHVFKIANVRAKVFCRVLSLTACVAGIAWTTAVTADGSSQPYGGGGPFPQFNAVISEYNRSGERFRIEGHCQSSCTMFLAIRNVCVDPDATLLFHAALSARQKDQPPDPRKNQFMLSHYNGKLRNFVIANHYMDSFEFHPISGHDIVSRFGYRQCPPR
jgi:hypothetical protein